MSKQQHKTEAKMRPTLLQVILGGGILLVGMCLGWVLRTPATTDVTMVRHNNGYTFINPLLTCNFSENKEFEEYKPFEAHINDLFTQDDFRNVTASVYYRDLNSGRWFGINENLSYSPASLLKVPLMIAELKREETHPGAAEERIMYTNKKDFNSLEYFQTPATLIAGNAYTVDELIGSMIETSDNNATNLLQNHLDQNYLQETFSDMGLSLPVDMINAGVGDYLSAKSFSYFFRILYNSTYLSREMSEKALTYLSHAHFPQGIAGGIPSEIKVAQKFGERSFMTSDGSVPQRELHDCGIVYYPEHPYLLCVMTMTKGGGFDRLSKAIRDISTILYSDVDREYSLTRRK